MIPIVTSPIRLQNLTNEMVLAALELNEIKALRFSTREPDERSLYLQSPGGHGHGGVDQVAHEHLHHHWMQQYQQIVMSCKTEEVISSH